MDRTDDIRIPLQTSWLNDPGARSVCDAIVAGGYAIYFVGGCVRNALLGLPDSDIDLSTNAPPTEVIRLVEKAGLKAVPTGIEHGTITVVAHGKGLEVTTFRRDVITDGRRAVVAFSDDIADDARRRDFTMNALYSNLNGQLLDPLGGLPDLLARRVRFIENANARIREDYLRILRYFRFHAWYANPELGMDTDALNAIARNSNGLSSLSAERIGSEMSKILAANDPSTAVAAMRQTGVLTKILPGSDDRFLSVLIYLEKQIKCRPDWVVRLVALGVPKTETMLHTSKAESRKLEKLTQAAWGTLPIEEIAYRNGEDVAIGSYLLRSAVTNVEPATFELDAVSKAAAAVFPLKGSDLIQRYQGRELGAKLSELEQIWVDSGFSLDRDQLLDRI